MRPSKLALFLGTAYLAYLAGISSTWVGTVRGCGEEIWEWYTPLTVLTLFGLPFLLGIASQKED